MSTKQLVWRAFGIVGMGVIALVESSLLWRIAAVGFLTLLAMCALLMDYLTPDVRVPGDTQKP